MESHGDPVDIAELYLHATPDLDELQGLVSGNSLRTAFLPEIPAIISQTPNQYLRFAYERIWAILVCLAYADFQKVTKTLGEPRNKKKARIKQQLVGSGGRFTDILYQGQRWKDLVSCSDCGILLLVKQRFLSVIPMRKFLIAQQYLSTIKDTEQLCRIVRNILSAFSPTDRVSISYYTKAYKELNDMITRPSLFSRYESPQVALVLQDLWTNRERHEEVDFCTLFITLYIHLLILAVAKSICTRRTVFTYKGSNSYSIFVPEPCTGVISMRAALSYAYLKASIPSQSKKFAIYEWKHLGSAIRFLSENLVKSSQIESILKIVWLLVHYQVVSSDSSDNRNWSSHSRLLGILQSRGICINYKWSLFPAYESIVKLTGLRNKMVANDGIDVKEFEKCGHLSPCCDSDCRQEYSMVRDLGCSKELLVAVGLINDIEVKTRELVDERVRQGQALMERIKAIKQWTKEPVVRNADVALKIARSFHLTAQIKLLVEIFE